MIREMIGEVVRGRDLTKEESSLVMKEVMEGDATPSQIAAFITALRIKGETVDEIAGMAITMRQKSHKVNIDRPLLDIVGTGGDRRATGPNRRGTINVSTAASFVAAAAGVTVAKHGGRSASGGPGSADALEANGVNINLGPAGVAQCIEEVGIGFMFAPVFHPSMAHALQPRQEIGIHTIFNLLGPLTNPASAQAQLLGVANSTIGEKIALVLSQLGAQRVWVVHGEEGLDEVSISGSTKVWELSDGQVRTFTIAPEDAGLSRSPFESILGGSKEENAKLLREVLQGSQGPKYDFVVLNAGAALVACNAANNLTDGVQRAKDAISNGGALEKLNALVELSQRLS
jgi:anthranilate phosphoribosyltransferase